MKWSKVNYHLDGFQCSVVFDTASNPGVQQIYAGKISCAKYGAMPILKSGDERRVMRVPDYAVVFDLVPPTPPKTVW